MLKYSFTVCEPEEDYKGRRHTYFVSLGKELQKLKPVLQKRWVRKLVEGQWGAPIKNFTQKRAWYETFFEKTEMEAGTEYWTVVVRQPNPGSDALATWLKI